MPLMISPVPTEAPDLTKVARRYSKMLGAVSVTVLMDTAIGLPFQR